MFKPNDVVIWEDPNKGLYSGVYRVYSVNEGIISISNQYSSVEVPPEELTPVIRDMRPIYSQLKYELGEGLGGNLDDLLSAVISDEDCITEYLEYLEGSIHQHQNIQIFIQQDHGEDSPEDREISDKIFFLQQKKEIVQSINKTMGGE